MSDSHSTLCKHCGEPIFDNGTVYVHRRSTFDETAKTKYVIDSQWCNDATRIHMAESADYVETIVVSPTLGPNTIRTPEGLATLGIGSNANPVSSSRPWTIPGNEPPRAGMSVSAEATKPQPDYKCKVCDFTGNFTETARHVNLTRHHCTPVRAEATKEPSCDLRKRAERLITHKRGLVPAEIWTVGEFQRILDLMEQFGNEVLVEEVAAPVPPTLKQIAEQIIRKIGDASTELIIVRNGLENESLGENGMEMTIPEVKEDLFNVLMGHDTGCLDPEDLSAKNCEVLWLESKLGELLKPESVVVPSAPQQDNDMQDNQIPTDEETAGIITRKEEKEAAGEDREYEKDVRKLLISIKGCDQTSRCPECAENIVKFVAQRVAAKEAEISRLTAERDTQKKSADSLAEQFVIESEARQKLEAVNASLTQAILAPYVWIGPMTSETCVMVSRTWFEKLASLAKGEKA